jgi:hypothetical protein
MTLARSPLPSTGPPPLAQRRGRRRRRALVLVVAFGLLLTGAVLGIVAGLGFLDSGRPVVERCDALLTKTVVHSLAPDQTDNAGLVTAIATQRALPARAATIALATAFQESKLRNIDYGDRDSLGLFQQRPSQGWGTEAQILDPVYATHAFYDVLVTVEGYEALTVTEAAQRVQRSAFPEAYAEHEQMARAFASALTGYSRASLTCRLRPASDEERAAASSSVLARLERDYAGGAATAREDGAVVVDARNLRSTSDEEELTRLAWGVAQWAVATADATGASIVATDGMVWRRSDGRNAEWHAVDEADTAAHAAPGMVVIA